MPVPDVFSRRECADTSSNGNATPNSRLRLWAVITAPISIVELAAPRHTHFPQHIVGVDESDV